MELILALMIIALGFVFVVEIIQVRKNKLDSDELKGATETYIEAYDSLRGVVNVNAAALRTLQAGVDRQDKQGAILSTLMDVILQAANITDLRARLESENLSNIQVETLEDDGDEEETTDSA